MTLFTFCFCLFSFALGAANLHAGFFDGLSGGGKSIPPIEGAERDRSSKANRAVLNGSATLENIQYSDLTVNGALDFLNLVVEQTLTVNGSADGQHLKAPIVIINGSGHCNHVNVEKLVANGSFSGQDIKAQTIQVTGFFKAADVDISTLTAVADIEITGGTIRDIQGRSKDTQTITLQGAARVTGNVTFESGRGEIILKDNAQILGKIQGGVVRQS